MMDFRTQKSSGTWQRQAELDCVTVDKEEAEQVDHVEPRF
jgi:hypothetical protein